MTNTSVDAQALPQQRRRAPLVGRALRILLGLILIVYATPAYFRMPVRLTIETLLLLVGLVGFYSLIYAVVSRCAAPFARFLCAVIAVVILVAFYVFGGHGSLVFGRGEGRLAVVTFLGVSLIVAGIRAVAGCEVMAIPGFLFRRDTDLACIIFSPLDKLERKLRADRNG